MKKISQIIILAITILSMFTIIATAFDDMPDDWSTPALQSAVDNGLLTGDGNLLKPRDTLTRAQMAAIVTRAFGAIIEADLSEFSDIPENAWYRDEMAKAYHMDILRGDGAGHMNPDKAVTRQEAFVVLARALCLDENASSESLDRFSDASFVADWAKGALSSLVSQGYVNGSDGKLNPNSNITRAEFAQLMYNLISLYVDDEADIALIPESNGNVVLRANVTPIKKLSCQRDFIVADGVVGKVVLEGVNVGSRIVVRSGASLVYSGFCGEIFSNNSSVSVTLEKGADVDKVIIPEGAKLIDNSKVETPSIPSTPSNPPSVETEDDIWTGFH
jgi:hypothetical protein